MRTKAFLIGLIPPLIIYGAVLCWWHFPPGRGAAPIAQKRAVPDTFLAVQYDYLDAGGPVLVPASGKIVSQIAQTVWPEDRYLVGWSPWIGFDRGSIEECYFALFVNGQRIFQRAPHKEGGGLMYDECQSEFFQANSGLLVTAGTPVVIQFGCHSTGGIQFNAQANAVVYSVIK